MKKLMEYSKDDMAFSKFMCRWVIILIEPSSQKTREYIIGDQSKYVAMLCRKTLEKKDVLIIRWSCYRNSCEALAVKVIGKQVWFSFTG